MSTLELLFDLLTDPWVILGLLAIGAILVCEWREGNRRIEDQREWERADRDEGIIFLPLDHGHLTVHDLRRQRDHALDQ